MLETEEQEVLWLGEEDLEEEMAFHCSILALDRGA